MSGTDATRCKVCGGPFAAKRVIIDGEQYHERCALASYPSHTHEDYMRLSDQYAALVKALEHIRRRKQFGTINGLPDRAARPQCCRRTARVMEIKYPVPRYRGPTFHDRKAERIRLKERTVCEAEHLDLRVPHNGFGWTGSRCSQCGFMFFGEFEPGFLSPAGTPSGAGK